MAKFIERVALFGAAALILAGCGETGSIFGLDRSGPDEFTVVRNPPLSVPPQATLRPPQEGEARSNRNNATEQARESLIASGVESVGSAGSLVTERGVEPYNGGPLPPAPASEQSPWYQSQQPQTAPQAATAEPAAPTAPGATAAVGGYPQYPAPTPLYATPGVPVRYGEQSRPSAGEAALAQRMTAYYGVEPDIRRKVDAESAQLALEQEKFLYTVLFWMDPEPVGTALDANAEARRLRENDALGKPVNSGEAPVIARKKSGISSLF